MNGEHLQRRIVHKAIGLFVGTLGVCVTPVARAQFSANFQTNVISGVTSNWVGDYVVGSNAVADVLLIQNSGVLSNNSAYLGYEVSSSNNAAVVTDSNTYWDVGYLLHIGESGGRNLLIITNGAKVYAARESILGNNNNGVSGGNQAIVTGQGSMWTNQEFFIGQWGPSNSIIVSQGGQIDISDEFYLGSYNPSSNNVLVLTDPGSLVTCLDVFVGLDGPFSTVIVSNGAHFVTTGYGNVAYWDDSVSNVVVVTGPGSRWDVGNDNPANNIYVGYGNGNQMTISNGGQIRNPKCFIDSEANNILITDPGSVWETTGFYYFGYSYWIGNDNKMTIANGGRVIASNMYVGLYGSNNNIYVSSGSLIVTNAGGGLIEVNNFNSITLNSGLLTANLLQVDQHGSIAGCGTINAATINNGTITVDCSGTLTFSGIVTNNGGLVATNGGVLEAYDLVVNNGPIDITNGSTNFHAGFVNNGTVITGAPSPVAIQVTSIARQGDDIRIAWQAPLGSTNALQAGNSDASGAYNTNNFTAIFTVTNTVGTVTNYLDVGGATNSPSRYYRVRLVP